MLASPSRAAPVVPTRQGDTTDLLFGQKVADPYRWLEDGNSNEVRDWTEKQNELTRKTLGAFPDRAKLEQRLWQLHELGSLGAPTSRATAKRRRVRRYFYTRRDGKQNQPILYVREGVRAPDSVLLDVNQDAPDGTKSLDWWFPSEDGALVAYGTSQDGNEESTLRIREVKSGRDLPDVIERTRACSVAWWPDGKGFYYTRYPAAGSVPPGEESYHRSVFVHRLGDDPARDEKIFGEGRNKSDWPAVALSPDGRWLLVEVSEGWSKSELFLLDTKTKGGVRPPPLLLTAGKEAQFDVSAVFADRFYVRTNDGAPRFALKVGTFKKPDLAAWTTVLPESEDTLEDVAVVSKNIAATYLKDASSSVRLFTAEGKAKGEVLLPGLGTVSALRGERDGDEVFCSFSSFLSPTNVIRHAFRSLDPRAQDLSWRRLVSPLDAERFEVSQVRATSKDGTSVPVFLVHRKDLPRDGKNPALLYGYGGFNVNLSPTFTPSLVPFLERGGIYALAVLRGGGEYGEPWHRAGMLEQKQHVFDDFIAAAEKLVADKLTSPARLAIEGRSNGGLLVGAALTQRPDLFRAVVCGVPLLDMVRYHRFRIAQLWIPEYGSPEDPKAFNWLYAYSPYHRVKEGTAYPAVLLYTALSDTRVDPMHARKMAARLQAATRSDRPILLRVETKAGHGQGKPLGKVIEQLTDEWSFLYQQLGMAF
jgi:prolyl oligopeptidase